MKARAVIQVSVSNHYREPDYRSEVVSQGLLWEQVELLERGADFCRIRQHDGYVSWVSHQQLAQPEAEWTDRLDWRTVRSHYARIFTAPDAAAPAVRDVVIGSKIPVLAEDKQWVQLLLPAGEKGWLQRGHLGEFGAPDVAHILALAREFLGYQYSWGGRTPKGFDCSGLVQTVFGLYGIALPRDAHMQQKAHLATHDHGQAVPGDLLFFGESPAKVTHVAIASGGGRFIHAYGMVRENSLDPDAPDFSRKHLETFISVNRYPLP